MTTRNALLALAALFAAALGISIYLYPSLPAQLPVHWGMEGNVDGWAPKAQAIAMIAGGIALMAVLLVALPWLSPRSFSVEPFRRTYNYVTVVIGVMLFAIHMVSMQAARHPEGDYGRALISLIFVFLALIGNVLGKTRRNFWMGWRTPWTLASEPVWTATHRLAGRLMFGVGLLGAAAVWLGAPMPAVLGAFIAAMLAPAVYSLVLYKMLEREGNAPDTAT